MVYLSLKSYNNHNEVIKLFVFYNPNPMSARVGDCVVRGISKIMNSEWYDTYLDLCLQGFIMADMPSANSVWGSYLKNKGYKRRYFADSGEFGITLDQFTKEHPEGTYLAVLNAHVVAVVDGDYYDTWNSGGEIVNYYWEQ